MDATGPSSVVSAVGLRSVCGRFGSGAPCKKHGLGAEIGVADVLAVGPQEIGDDERAPMVLRVQAAIANKGTEVRRSHGNSSVGVGESEDAKSKAKSQDWDGPRHRRRDRS